MVNPVRSLVWRNCIARGTHRVFKMEWFKKGRSTCEYSRVFLLNSTQATKEKFTIVANRGYNGDFDFCNIYDISQREDMDNAECNGVVPKYTEIKRQYEHQ